MVRLEVETRKELFRVRRRCISVQMSRKWSMNQGSVFEVVLVGKSFEIKGSCVFWLSGIVGKRMTVCFR